MIRNSAAVLIALSLAAPVAYAEEPVVAPPPVTNIRASIENVRFDLPDPVRPASASQSGHHYSVATKASAGVAMGVLGALVGGMVGVPLTYMTGLCATPYVSVIGGAAGGAVLGVWLASR